MEETLVALGGFRCLVGRQHAYKFCSQQVGVHHLALGISGMHAHPLEADFGSCCIEVFKFQVAQVAAVDGIGPLAAKLLHVKVVCTHADFLVGVESHADVSMLYFVVVAQPAHGLYDFGNARLVVSTQQGVPVGHDQVFALVSEQFWKFLGRRHDTLRKHDVVAVIVSDDARLHVGTAAVGRRVIVADETDGGHLFLDVRFQRGIHISHLVHLHIVKALFFELVSQRFGKYKLFGGTWHTVAVLSRLCVKTHILQKSFNNVHDVYFSI